MPDSHLLPVLRRRWRALLLGTVIAAIVGYAAASTATKSYEARVDLLVGPVNGTAELDASGGLARTYADLATSEPVLRKALRASKDPRTVDDFRRAITTSSNAITRIVTVAVRDRDPRVAAELANDVGHQLRRLANATPPRASAALETFSHRSELAPLSNEDRDSVLLAASKVFGASDSGRIGVVQAADAPERPASPSVPLMTALAALAGLCLAALAVLAQEARARGRAEAQPPAPAFGGPVSVVDGTRAAARLALARVGSGWERAGSDHAESYRMLAERARLFDGGERALSLLVVDSGDGSSAAVVAASLADAVAAEGRRVILVDFDPHGSGVTDLLGLEGRLGYTNVVGDAATSGDGGALEEVLVPRGQRLSVLARGTAAPPRRESVARMSTLVGGLRERADVVIMAGPSLTRSSTMIAWSRTVDQVCLVVDSSNGDDEAPRVVVGLKRLDGGFVGAVLHGGATAPRTRHRLRVS